jgi:site-specific recombinase XerD
MKGARPLTPDEIAAVSQSFFGEYAVRDKCLFLLGINIGARVSELTALQVGDVWQHSRPVDILTLRKGTVKGKKESHFVPLNATAKAVISELMSFKQMQNEDTKPGAYLFASRKGSGRLSRVQAHRILKKAYQHAFLTGKVTTHSMRKTVANTVYSATSDLFVVKEILGHKNLSTTQQYLGVGIDKLQEAMETLDECNFPSNTLHSTQKLKKRQLKKGFRKREEGKVVYYEKKRQV